MTSAAQPNPIDGLHAEAELTTEHLTTEEEADGQPEYAGDMPDDPEQAVHYRPGRDGPGGSMDDREGA